MLVSPNKDVFRWDRRYLTPHFLSLIDPPVTSLIMPFFNYQNTLEATRRSPEEMSSKEISKKDIVIA
jgi:hypothetical protein